MHQDGFRLDEIMEGQQGAFRGFSCLFEGLDDFGGAGDHLPPFTDAASWFRLLPCLFSSNQRRVS